MKSPFPGMGPYIEACGLWGDFHDEMIRGIKSILQDELPSTFLVRTSKRSYIALTDGDEKDERAFLPDVHITAPRRRIATSAVQQESTPASTAITEPVSLRAFVSEEFEETFIDIFEVGPDRRLVTSIEVLSPSNKRRGSEGWLLYQRKRQALLLGQANLVEIDLLRGGERQPMLDPWPDSPYSLLVARKEKAPRCKVWPAFFERPLPTIPIPLEQPHLDIAVDVQKLFETIYERGRYRQDIDYANSLDPLLTAEQTARLQERLRAGETASKPASRKRKSKR
jgi:hypothetical protein